MVLLLSLLSFEKQVHQMVLGWVDSLPQLPAWWWFLI
jgi:hypothetical protein